MSFVWFTAGIPSGPVASPLPLQRPCHVEIGRFAGFRVTFGLVCGNPCRAKTAECRDSMVHLNHSLTMPA
jgi:hypothetical protein